MLFKEIFSLIERKNGLICGVIIALIFSGVGFAQTFESSQLQWTEGMSGKLIRGEVISYKGYTVQAVAFPAPVESAKYKPEPEEPVEPFVGLNISKNGRFISTVVLGLEESYVMPDGELKVTAKELPAKNAKEWIFESYAPWAVIELNPRGIPRLGVSIQTDKDKYVSSYTTEVVATLKIENSGSADAVNVDLVIDTELPINRGSLKYHYDKIKIGETITETLTFASPILAEPKTFSISANVKGYDVMDMPYTAASSKSIPMAAELPVILSVRKSTVDKMYLKDYTIISLSVKNNGRYDAKNVNITDSIPDSFRLLGSQPLHWVVDIPVNEEWEYRYLVRPQEADKEGIVFPAATAEFTVRNEFYSVRSNQPRVIVYGPKIVLKKQTDVSEFNPGDTVTVTVTAENTGSTPTRVIIMDTLPDKVTLISGTTSREGFLEATMKMSYSYTLRIDSRESITLPAAVADYYELGSKGRKISVTGRELELPIKSAKKTPVPTPQITATITTPAVTVPKTLVPTPQITATITAPAVTVPKTPVPAVTPPAKTLDEILSEAYNYLGSLLGFGKPRANVSITKVMVDNMLLKDYTSISLSVKNNETYDLKNALITDSIPESFRLLGNQSLRWVVDIPAGGILDRHYLIRPLEPGEGIVFPAADAEFTINNKLYSVQSNQPKMTVHGPKIVLRKQADVSEVMQGDTVNVTVVAENTGNTPTRVTVMDILPNNATLVSGNTSIEGVLEANMKLSFSYTLKIDSRETLKLPPATADYYESDSKGRKITTKSLELELKVKPRKTPAQIAAPTSTVAPSTIEQLRKVDSFLYSLLGFGKSQVNLSITKVVADNMSLKDYTSISLSVKNNGKYDAKNVNITDSIPESFRLLGNQSLLWIINISAGEEWEHRYLVRPLEPGEGIMFPAANVEFTINNKLYSVQSNQPKMIVYGPKIVLRKQADVSEVRRGETVNITVVAENTGNAPTRVTVVDILPNNVTLVRGNTSIEGVLEANMKLSFSYTLKIDSRETLKLPPATADYYEFGSKGRKITMKSLELEIKVK